MGNYLTAYHIVNAIGVALYPIYRANYNNIVGNPLTGNREYQVLFTVIIISLVKLFRSISWEEWIHNFFIYGKTASALLFVFQDYRLGIWYIIFCLMVWIFLRIPHYTGPSKMQEIFTEEDCNNIINDPQSKSKVKLILFYADWSDACLFVILL